MSHTIQHVAFAVNNLFPQQHSKVIKSTKGLKSITESTVKAASLFNYNTLLFVTSSITTEKMSKIPMQYQLANISTGMIMTLTITEKSLS